MRLGKHIAAILPAFLWCFTAYGDTDKGTPIEIKTGDLDNDGVTDSIWYDYCDSVIVFKLSSRDFQPFAIAYDMEGGAPDRSYLTAREGEFYTTIFHMRSSDYYTYQYEPESGRFRLAKYNHENYGNAANDGSGTMTQDFLTGKFTADWNYYDHEIDSLIALPTVTVYVDNPPIYLGDTTDFAFPGYELYESYKKAYQEPSIDTVRFTRLTYDYDYAELEGQRFGEETLFCGMIACNHEELNEGDLLRITTGIHCYQEPGDGSYRAAVMITEIKVIEPGKTGAAKD